VDLVQILEAFIVKMLKKTRKMNYELVIDETINKWVKYSVNRKNVEDCIKELENRDMIEVVDEEGKKVVN